MAKRTLTELITAVGYYFEITPGAATDPTTTEITAWLNDAQRLLCKLLPAEALGTLIKTEDVSAASASSVAGPTGYQTLEAVDVANDGVSFKPARIVKPELGQYALTNTLLQDSDHPIAWFSDNKIYWSPATSTGGKIRVVYVGTPTALTGSATTDLPEYCENALIFYATAQGKAQDEEMAEYETYMKAFMTECELIAARFGYGGGTKQ
jgi:hypothetical protein